MVILKTPYCGVVQLNETTLIVHPAMKAHLRDAGIKSICYTIDGAKQ